MTTILAGGVGKDEVARAIAQADPSVTVITTNDMDAANLLGEGTADYFLGTCHTGAGASLGVLVALLGNELCHTFGRSAPSVAEIGTELNAGKVAFGFSMDQTDRVVPAFLQAVRESQA